MIKNITYCSNDKCEVKTKCKRSLHTTRIPEGIMVSVIDGEHCENPQNIEDKYLYFMEI